MKRIKAACLEQTVHFQPKDQFSYESTKRQAQQEYAVYKDQLERNRTKYRIIEEAEQPDGSLIIKIKKQNNTQPVGDYLD